MKGKCKWFNQSKGFGFIEGEDGQDYFVHHSALNGLVIKDDDNVNFEPVETEKGKQAQEIKVE